MSAEFLSALLRSSVAISLATLLVLLLRRPLRQALGAQAAYLAWLLPPMATIAALLPMPQTSVLAPIMRIVSGMPGMVSGPIAIASVPQAHTTSLLLAMWLAGIAATLFVFAFRQARFNFRILRRPNAPYDEVRGHGPAVTGLWRQRIVLPSDFGQRYNDDEQVLVIAHEQTHLRRGDVHAQTLATAIRCVFWFNPLLHFAASRFRFDQELACDAAVLTRFPSSASRRCYGEAMLKTQMAEFGAPIGCHWQSCHPLKERITMLKKPLPGALRRVSGTILVAALVCTGSLTAWAAQPASKHVISPAIDNVSFAKNPPPAYPADAIAKKQQGKVLLRVLVSASGTVAKMKLEKSSGVAELDKSAMAAAMQWTFHPKMSNGKPVAVWVRVPVEFQL